MKTCCDCRGSTNNYYPLWRSNQVRCAECHERKVLKEAKAEVGVMVVSLGVAVRGRVQVRKKRRKVRA